MGHYPSPILEYPPRVGEAFIAVNAGLSATSTCSMSSPRRLSLKSEYRTPPKVSRARSIHSPTRSGRLV